MIKGLEYEMYINEHLNSDINEHVKISYMWKNVPDYVLFDYGFINDYNQHRMNIKNNENPLQDIGTDILYLNQEKECVIVQCKNYSNSVRIDDLAGFYYIMHIHSDKKGEVYYTSSLSKLINESKNIKYIKKEIVYKNEEIVIIKPYEYQQKIIDIAIEYYKDNDSGIISLPCGTGKTLISCYIAMNYNVVIIITPLKQYAKQNIDRFLEYEKDRKCLLIDSDGTRNVDEVNKFIKSNTKILLSCTYKSCDIIVELINKLENVMVIFDEFHNFSYNNIYNEKDCINILINSSKCKKLYLSATPRVYELEDNNDVDVREILGEYIYQMSFNEAIDKRYISDYEVYLPIFEIEENIMNINELNIHKDYLQKVLFLVETIKMFGLLKVIVYVRDHKEVYEFIENFNKINEHYCYNIWIDSVTCNDSYKIRNRVLSVFEAIDKISILVSVHILDEAIDVRSCNAVYMTYSCKSKGKNIQRLSRALRYQYNKIAKILLYCMEIDDCLDFISSVREYDIKFVDKIRYVSVSEKILRKNIRNEKHLKKFNENKFKVIGIKLYRSENWYEKLEKIKLYINENNKRPTQKDKNINIKQLGSWISNQIKNYNKKSDIMKDENIYNTWYEFVNNSKYKEYFLNYEEVWYDNLNKVKNYIDKYNKRPSNTDKDTNIKYLGRWISNQITNYNKKSQIMKDENIYNSWYEFINDSIYQEYFLNYEEIWYNNLEKVKNYINEYNKRPSVENKDINIKQLGSWISTQITNYKKKSRIMKDKNIYNSWYEFINDSIYQEYFLSNEEVWYNNLEKVKLYINENNKRPSHHDKNINIKQLGGWLCKQVTNYNEKSDIMKDENIYNTWYEFINDNKYQEYFLSNEEVWYNNLEKVKLYINENNKRPSYHDKNINIKQLGGWLCKQVTNYNEKLQIMKDEDIYNSWYEFINDSKYQKYFK